MIRDHLEITEKTGDWAQQSRPLCLALLGLFWIPRFLKQFDIQYAIANKDECWPWNGRRSRDGYGVFCIDGIGFKAHRISYVMRNDWIPQGFLIRHRCDNPPCVNPRHLQLGKDIDNARDRVIRKWAKLTAEDVRDIREFYEPGVRGKGIHKLASRYSVSPNTISRIVSRESWAWII